MVFCFALKIKTFEISVTSFTMDSAVMVEVARRALVTKTTRRSNGIRKITDACRNSSHDFTKKSIRKGRRR
jgi:hypothetical protein